MSSRSHRGPMFALGLTLLALSLAAPMASGQSNASVSISTPSTEAFPTITFFLTLGGPSPASNPPLTPANVEVIEDGESRSPTRLDRVERGTRQLYVINSAPPMAVRDSRGRSRYFFIRQALQRWWNGAEATRFGIDDLTLVSADGPLVEHSSSSALLASRLQVFTPSYESDRVGLALLLDSFSYLDSASESSQIPSFVIFLTSTLRVEEDLALTNAIARAQELGATLFPVVIDSPEAIQSNGLEALTTLAEQTGGVVFLLDPANANVDELSQRLLAQRNQYRVEYQSQAGRAGFHEIIARVSTGDLLAASAPSPFEISVEAPQVVLVQPPASITRQAPDPALATSDLAPTELPLQLVILFPDGHPRQIVESSLLVDGEVVDTRLEPPFDVMTWDLRAVRTSGRHTLAATVRDQLGLVTRSASHNVEVGVIGPPTGLAALRPALEPFLLIIGLLMGGAVTAWLVLGYRRRASLQPGRQAAASPGPRRLRRARLQPESASNAEAVLVPVYDGESESSPIPLLGSDLTLGRDASLSAYPLDDPSVSGLHARLIRQAGGAYLLRDQGSIAGTWVNYDPVGKEGILLRHGDIVHLGRVCLRFQRAHQPPPQVLVEPIDDGAEGQQTSRRPGDTN